MISPVQLKVNDRVEQVQVVEAHDRGYPNRGRPQSELLHRTLEARALLAMESIRSSVPLVLSLGGDRQA